AIAASRVIGVDLEKVRPRIHVTGDGELVVRDLVVVVGDAAAGVGAEQLRLERGVQRGLAGLVAVVGGKDDGAKRVGDGEAFGPEALQISGSGQIGGALAAQAFSLLYPRVRRAEGGAVFGFGVVVGPRQRSAIARRRERNRVGGQKETRGAKRHGANVLLTHERTPRVANLRGRLQEKTNLSKNRYAFSLMVAVP